MVPGTDIRVETRRGFEDGGEVAEGLIRPLRSAGNAPGETQLMAIARADTEDSFLSEVESELATIRRGKSKLPRARELAAAVGLARRRARARQRLPRVDAFALATLQWPWLDVVRVGAPPILLLRKGRVRTPSSTTGPRLGGRWPGRRHSRLELRPGDRLMMHTVGIEEEVSFEDRCAMLGSGLGASDICKNVLQARGCHREDDAVLVAVFGHGAVGAVAQPPRAAAAMATPTTTAPFTVKEPKGVGAPPDVPAI